MARSRTLRAVEDAQKAPSTGAIAAIREGFISRRLMALASLRLGDREAALASGRPPRPA